MCVYAYVRCAPDMDNIVCVCIFGVHLIWTEELRGSGVKEGEGELAWAREPASHLVVQ